MRTKTVILVFTLLFFLKPPAEAQESLKIKHVKGLQACSASFLFTEEGQGCALGYWRFLSDKFAVDAGIEYENGNTGYTSIRNISVYGKGHYTVLDFKKTAYLSLFAAGRLGQEKYSIYNVEDQNGAFPEQERFAASLGLGISTETYIATRLALCLSFEQILLAKDLYWQGQGGFRFYL